ncbi:MAG: HAMP domain-containing sensor histidine kinase [Candidatus Krumholzibacteria bacterium]|nr:HAMP domain-containing sensor histidine kinase [Candidatus Krumholzibacteria bacterium]
MKRRRARRAPGNLRTLLAIYFIAGTVVLVGGAVWYNSSLISRMREQAQSTTRLFSRFVGFALREVGDQTRRDFIRDVQGAMTLPFVLTDSAGRPMVWNGIDVPMLADDEYQRVIDYDPESPNDPILERVQRIAGEFDGIHEPVAVETQDLALVIHYGRSRLSRELAVAPYVQIGVLVIFLLFGFLMFRAVKTGEQRSIWVGMAKETAHQLGTPLSSIMGWLAVIGEEAERAGCAERLGGPIGEASADVERLGRISSRFSKIGSDPDLEYQELAPVIEEAVRYFERRRPALRINSTIETAIEELPLVRCSAELLGWVFENLIKNSLDAIAEEGGKIHITGRLDAGEGMIEILFSDNGRGMSASVRKRVFSPGFTTKSRGWGLGLALVKRIVEEIHGGTIRVLHTQPGRGTTFQILFPVD